MTDLKAAAPMATIQPIARLTGPHGDHIAFERGGKRWALADGRSLQLGSDGMLDRTVTSSEPVLDLRWSADGTRLLAGPQIYDPGRDRWEQLAGLDEAMTSGLDEPPDPGQLGVAAAAYAPDGQDLVIAAYFQPSRERDSDDGYRGPRERLLVIGPDRALRATLYAGNETDARDRGR